MQILGTELVAEFIGAADDGTAAPAGLLKPGRARPNSPGLYQMVQSLVARDGLAHGDLSRCSTCWLDDGGRPTIPAAAACPT